MTNANTITHKALRTPDGSSLSEKQAPLLDEQPNPCPSCSEPLYFDPDACEMIVESRWMEYPGVMFECPACRTALAILPVGKCSIDDGTDENGEAFLSIGPPSGGFAIGVVNTARRDG